MTDTLTIADLIVLLEKLTSADYQYRICPECKDMRPDTAWTCDCSFDIE